ncbi:GTP-binding protein HSR1-related protein [Hyella patelloides LEGE 07179]|uniref:GTP-binding protein HSR1-related protein n=1 Tax=Hyella patelloides LEGE 07179 TaxID=945734 RepID=A0A563VJV1_9CYAN|nr:GTPase [Hyella patelloides]VEP11756.1 GTP-binding protein HSR1-related protein [Hyella patelloides LEGE 07179]
MTHVDEVALKQLDYKFLLFVHLICADKQIHSEEIKYLKKLGDLANISQATKDEIEKIFAQDSHHLTINCITKQISIGEQSEVMRQILAIAYADGYFAPSEREMLDRLASLWSWSQTEMDRMIAEVESSSDRGSNNDDSDQTELSFAAKLLKNEKKSALSRAIIDMATKVAPEVIGQKVERLEREILLSGAEYDEVIKHCSKIAQEDYQYAELAFKKTESTLKTLILSLEEVIARIDNDNSKAKTAKEVAKQLEDSKQSLDAEIIKKLAQVKESHQAKQRALNQFSIAFMGRTKAGKSTLHSIITQDGWESIGVGKQRTTRFNRVYQWKNIRIIDTPGIGAADAGGRDDEEIAKSIVDEADVICYVVTNDSIQEPEFQFLKLLKEKAKPLIILLNIKYNLRDSRRLQHFLKNPNKLFVKDGKSGISGHIDRICRYAKQYYANDYFDIVPVMLLAAQLSSEPEHQKDKDKLYRASRIQDFLDSIRESLIKHGAIRRSQTFLGSTVGAVEYPNQWIKTQKKAYQSFSNTLKSKQENIRWDIKKAQKNSCEYLEKQIETIFKDIINAISQFAEDNWKADEYTLNCAWKQKIKDIKLQELIQISNKEAVEKFNQAVKESLEEVEKELILTSQLNFGEFELQSQNVFDNKNLLKIGGSILAVVGAGLMFFAPPIAVAVGLFGTGLNLISNLFTSKAEKRREAVAQISDSLRSQIKQQKQSVLTQSINNLELYCSDISKEIASYFKKLTEGLDDISYQLENARSSLDIIIDYLNYGYAKRIIDWTSEQYEPLTVANAKKIIAKVDRKFGHCLKIQTKNEIEHQKPLEEIKHILQEDIAINSSKTY